MSSRGFSVDFRNTLGTVCDSHVDRARRRAKYNSLSNVRPEDRQVGAFFRIPPYFFASPRSFAQHKDVTSSQGRRGPAFAMKDGRIVSAPRDIAQRA